MINNYLIGQDFEDTGEENLSILGAALNMCKELQYLRLQTTGTGLGMLPAFHCCIPRLSPQPTGSNVELGLRYSFKLQYQHKDRFLVLIVSSADTGCK